MKKLKFGSKSLTYKILVSLILIILPFNVASVAITVISIGNARDQVIHSIDNLASMTIQQLDVRLSAMNDFFYNLDQTQPDFKLYKKQGEKNAEVAMAEASLARYFNSIVGNKAFADVLFWESSEYDAFYIGMDALQNSNYGHNTEVGVTLRNTRRKAVLKDFLQSNEKKRFSSWSLAEIEGMLWLIKIYAYGDFYYGSMISLDEVEYTLKNNSTYSQLDVKFASAREDFAKEKGSLTVVKGSKNADLWMEILIPSSEGYSRLSVMQKMCIVFAFFYLLLIPFLIYLINRMILKPLGRISSAMKSLRNGNPDYRIPLEEEAEEFMEIDQTFNEMADRITELKISNYEKEIERQRVELRNLQLQIRPHFLMNMFNLLFSFAQIESYQNIQKLSLYLSDYFRYIFQSGKELQPFGLELELIRKYLEIAAMRYPNCFEAVYEIDPEAMEVEVPPLLIHNFVENVFKHIVNYDKVIHLRIEVYTDDKEATFMIADDGPGMPEGMAEEINQGIFRKRQNDRIHVGIENSWKRLQYFYGEKGTLTVESEPGQGTCFTILIPLGEKKDESVNCR